MTTVRHNSQKLSEPDINKIWFKQWLYFLFALVCTLGIVKVLLDIAWDRSAWDERTVTFTAIAAALAVVFLRRSLKAHWMLTQQFRPQAKERTIHETTAPIG